MSSEKLSLVRCSSCNRPIPPYERAIKFPCPNCGRTTIIRCERCRKLVNNYICINCGFKGP
ncbi:MAG: zinc finger domain-containing protein [Thermoproteota archaeon]|jgi:Predicted Zn-ribbon RNA-binding protein with a function in translation